METGKKLAEKTERRFQKNRAGNISQLNALLKGNRWTRTTLVVSFGLFFPPLCLSLSFPSWTNAAQKRWHRSSFQTCNPDVGARSVRGGFFHSLLLSLRPCRQYDRESGLHKSGIIYLCSRHILCCDHDCFTDPTYETRGVRPTPWGAVGSTSTGEKRGYQACGEAALGW